MSQSAVGGTQSAGLASAASTTSGEGLSYQRAQARPTSEEAIAEMERVKKAWEVEGSVERAELMRRKGSWNLFTKRWMGLAC